MFRPFVIYQKMVIFSGPVFVVCYKILMFFSCLSLSLIFVCFKRRCSLTYLCSRELKGLIVSTELDKRDDSGSFLNDFKN